MAWIQWLLGRTKSASDERAAGEHALSERKQERASRRELLYVVIRECMTQGGILSSSYQFKVLSLDARGQQYLVMIDLPHSLQLQAAQQINLEKQIARQANERHTIHVTGVYWRISDSHGLSRQTDTKTLKGPEVKVISVTEQSPSLTDAVTAQNGRADLEARFAEVHKPGASEFQDTEIFPPQS
jgi:hypothetical protein